MRRLKIVTVVYGFSLVILCASMLEIWQLRSYPMSPGTRPDEGRLESLANTKDWFPRRSVHFIFGGADTLCMDQHVPYGSVIQVTDHSQVTAQNKTCNTTPYTFSSKHCNYKLLKPLIGQVSPGQMHLTFDLSDVDCSIKWQVAVRYLSCVIEILEVIAKESLHIQVVLHSSRFVPKFKYFPTSRYDKKIIHLKGKYRTFDYSKFEDVFMKSLEMYTLLYGRLYNMNVNVD